uniref:DNA-directed RNA polymerase III subunit RPC9 n=1 Tax=Equus caballus TaxID=9796 RepID=A0A9L0TLR0_HORSE
MEVKDANSALLSNYEVFQLLTDLKEQRKESGKNKHSSGQQNLNTITYETLKYISKTPCRHQSPEIVREFLTAMKSHKLTKIHYPLLRQTPSRTSTWTISSRKEVWTGGKAADQQGHRFPPLSKCLKAKDRLVGKLRPARPYAPPPLPKT